MVGERVWPWAVDVWSDAAAGRLRRVYAESALDLAARGRALRQALAVNQIGAADAQPTLFVQVPVSSYDECLAFESLLQVVGIAGCNVFVALVLPDAASQEMAMHRACRDNLSKLMYFLDAQAVEPARICTESARFGSTLFLLESAPLAPAQMAAIAAHMRQWRFLQQAVASDRSDAVQYVHCRHVDGPELEAALVCRAGTVVASGSPPGGPHEGCPGFLTTSGATGEVIGASHAWLDTLQNMPRLEPILLANRRPTQRIWFDRSNRQALGVGAPAPASVQRDLDASRLTCYANRSGPGNDMVFAFALGHGCRVAYAEDHGIDEAPGTAFVWGVLRGSDAVVRAAVDNGRSFLYSDHAYFNRGHLASYRIILNGHATTALRRCPDDRTAALGVTLKSWRKQGRHVLVCPPTEYFMRAHGCPNWVANTLSTLRRHTDRPVVIRDKPKAGVPGRTLDEDLEDCHALVTHSSNVGVEAAVLGVPVFGAPTSAMSAVGCSDLAQIETPALPDRRLWLANLAYTQFSFDEILNGRVLSLIADYWDREVAE